MTNVITTKCCSKCGEDKPLSEYYANKNYKDGYKNECKECGKKYAAKHHQQNKDRRYRLNNEWKRNNRPSMNAQNTKRRATQKQLTPPLSQEDNELISLMYEIATNMTEATGYAWHVDHVCPLAAGGIHHPCNLKVVPATYNLKKNARIDDQNPGVSYDKYMTDMKGI